MRLARATGGGVEYWMGLPLSEMMDYLQELVDQLKAEAEALEAASKGR
jgi:hypothetical protein